MEASHAVLEGFIELAESSNDKVEDCIDIGISFFLRVDYIVFFISIFLPDAKQIVDRIFKYLGDLL